MSMQTARDEAKAYLRKYVLRGDSAAEICEGSPGWSYLSGVAGQIGGTARHAGRCRNIPAGELVITRLAGQDCFVRFPVTDLIAEIRAEIQHEPVQQRLF